MEVLWNHNHEAVLTHVVHRMMIYDVSTWEWGIFSIEKQYFLQLSIAGLSSSGVCSSYARVTFLISVPGLKPQTPELSWVRMPSPIISLKLGYSNLTPIYFFKNMLSVGCLLHITSSLNINRTYYLYYFKISKETRVVFLFFRFYTILLSILYVLMQSYNSY